MKAKRTVGRPKKSVVNYLAENGYMPTILEDGMYLPEPIDFYDEHRKIVKELGLEEYLEERLNTHEKMNYVFRDKSVRYFKFSYMLTSVAIIVGIVSILIQAL